MKTRLCSCLIVATTLLSLAQSQVLSGDPQFSPLHEIGWTMAPGEIRALCETEQIQVGGTDSTLTFKSSFIGAPATTEIRFHHTGRGPAFIHVKFDEPTKPLIDTLTSHFTQLTGSKPLTSVTEKKFFVTSIRMEIARWKTEKESIVLTTALRDGAIGDVGLIISRFAE